MNLELVSGPGDYFTADFTTLHDVLKGRGLATGLGDEGGFAPSLGSNREAVELLVEAVERAGYQPGVDVAIALDVAATELAEDGAYRLAREGRTLDAAGMADLYEDWVTAYPIISIEDGLAEDDWEGWAELTRRLGVA